jgi:hypothetical protein
MTAATGDVGLRGPAPGGENPGAGLCAVPPLSRTTLA